MTSERVFSSHARVRASRLLERFRRALSHHFSVKMTALLDLPDDILVEIFCSVKGVGQWGYWAYQRGRTSPTPLARLACVSRRLRTLVTDRCWELKASRCFPNRCAPAGRRCSCAPGIDLRSSSSHHTAHELPCKATSPF